MSLIVGILLEVKNKRIYSPVGLYVKADVSILLRNREETCMASLYSLSAGEGKFTHLFFPVLDLEGSERPVTCTLG